MLHGVGALMLFWMILDRWSVVSLPIIGAITVLVPCALEAGLTVSQWSKFKAVAKLQ